MKKLLTAALACCIAVSALCLGVNAQGKNYLSAEWGKGLDASVEKKEDGVYKITNLKNQWSSPFLPSLASIKDAVSKEESIIVTFKIRAVYKAGNEGEYTTARVLFRGTTPEKIADNEEASEEWKAKYEESLDGENAVFECNLGNVMYYGSAIEFTDSEWTLVEWPMALTSAQVDNKMITEWNLCIDTVKDNTLLAGIEIKDAGIYCESDYVSQSEPEETPEPEEPEQPDEEATPTPTMKNVFGETTPTPTVAAEATATVEATEVPNDTKGGNSLWWVWVIVAVVVVAGGGAAVYFFVIKKKKDGKAE